MGLREQFEEVLKATGRGETADIEFNIEGIAYRRLFKPKERLIILGGGHISKCLCVMASMVDFEVVVVDDREEYACRERFPEADRVICGDFPESIASLNIDGSDYVVVVTRSHRYDADCLRAVLGNARPYYTGLLGSKKRTTNLLATLEAEGIPGDLLSEIHTPIGLDIGALTVEEITVSIVAELIKYRRINLRKKSGSRIFIEETFHLDVVEEIVRNPNPQVLLLVYDTIGSAPVKSGCFMIIDKDGAVHGTIGGGLAENLALKEASGLVGTGQNRTIVLDLTDDDGEEGMVCGGTMKIYLTDI